MWTTSYYGPKGDYTNSPTLSGIIRWFTWFMTTSKSISPREQRLKMAQLRMFRYKDYNLQQENKDSKVEFHHKYFICNIIEKLMSIGSSLADQPHPNILFDFI